MIRISPDTVGLVNCGLAVESLELLSGGLDFVPLEIGSRRFGVGD